MRSPHRAPPTWVGLGLFICHEIVIVRAHRGTIAVTSRDDGTTFQVRLPA